MTRGLTLIELLVALVILAIASVLILPNFRESYREIQIRHLLRNLEKDIQFAQYHSTMEGRRYLMEYDRTEHAYRFLGEDRSKSYVDWIPIRGTLGRPRKLPPGTELWFRGKAKIFFLPNGTISEGDIAVRTGLETIAVLHLGRSLRGVEIERKGRPHAA